MKYVAPYAELVSVEALSVILASVPDEITTEGNETPPTDWS